jgi:hypothetical protein
VFFTSIKIALNNSFLSLQRNLSSENAIIAESGLAVKSWILSASLIRPKSQVPKK